MSAKATRLNSVGTMRGLLIVFIVLDHANDIVALKYSIGEH